MSFAPPGFEPTPSPSEPSELAGAPEPAPGEMPRWSPGGVPLAFAIGLAVTLVVGLLVSVLAVGLGADADDLRRGVNIVLTVAQDAAFVGAAIYVAGRVARPAAWQFGLRAIRPRTFAIGLVVAFVAFTLFSAVYGAVVDVGPQEELPDELGADGSTYALVAAAFLVTVVAPIAEELFFRGYVFGALRTWKGMWVGAILTGLLFGAIHLGSAPDVLYLPLLAVLGLVLCLLYARTGSLYPCIVLHALNNCVAFAGTRDGWTWEVAVLLAGSLGSIALFGRLAGRLGGPAPPVPART